MTLESKSYVAQDEDIAALTQSLVDAQSTLGNGNTTYLRALIATAQQALGAQPRVRAGKIKKLDEASIAAHLAALTTVHDRFYAVVLRVCGADKPTQRELNRRSNFARTAVYALRVWVKAGNDMTALAAARTSKVMLRVVGRRHVRPLSVKRLMSRAEKQSKACVSALLALGQEHPAEAAQELELLMAQLTDQLGAITGAGKPAKAVRKRFEASKTQVLSKAEVARVMASGVA